jgi:hypothetical protein
MARACNSAILLCLACCLLVPALGTHGDYYDNPALGSDNGGTNGGTNGGGSDQGSCEGSLYDNNDQCVEPATNCKIALTDSPAGDERLNALCTSDACMQYVGCLREVLESSGCLWPITGLKSTIAYPDSATVAFPIPVSREPRPRLWKVLVMTAAAWVMMAAPT